RSGKSLFAVKLGEKMGKQRVLIATGQALDFEMESRIQKHKAARSKTWITYEEPVALNHVLEKVNGQCDVILIDCLSLWLSNLLHLDLGDQKTSASLKEFLRALKSLTTPAILISNEVGLGGIPINPLARRFCDLAGALHQEIASLAHEVYVVTSGIATRVK
ncbi:MAG: bifunctional adenosylcobinamide kinase/adenosylcobinamide-phosphate guanylyltransferase, partial [Nitrospira sp.]|nr:bifunctional adenosylcobinamide kinase/adenosylcobinamide-phosphate guanylyltransferase [Nitrospira sp.]